MNNTLKGYATETWVLKRLSKFKATSSSTSGAQIVGSTHEHANKETLDKLTEDMIKVLGTLSIDENGHLCSSVGLYSQSFVSAFGLNSSADIFEKVTESSGAYIKANYDIKNDGDILASSTLSFVMSQTNTSTLSYRGKLRPVTYTKNGDTSSNRIGFVAQEVQSLYPELVQTKHGVTCLDYQSCTAVLAAQINALSDALDALKVRL